MGWYSNISKCRGPPGPLTEYTRQRASHEELIAKTVPGLALLALLTLPQRALHISLLVFGGDVGALVVELLAVY